MMNGFGTGMGFGGGIGMLLGLVVAVLAIGFRPCPFIYQWTQETGENL